MKYLLSLANISKYKTFDFKIVFVPFSSNTEQYRGNLNFSQRAKASINF